MIASLATGIGIEMGLPTEEIERIRIASLLHDLGKIAIPEEILDKPTALTARADRSHGRCRRSRGPDALRLVRSPATRRRRAAPADGPLDDERPRRRGTAEEEVTATLHRRTLRRSKMRPDEDVIVASMGSNGMPSAESAAHPARRTHRRSPPN